MTYTADMRQGDVVQAYKRDSLIDVLRGLSIMAVLIGHFDIAYHLDDCIPGGITKSILLNLIIRNEHYAVIAFFAISGFLITSNTQRRYGWLGRINPVSFYALRFARIMPCLILMLVAIGVFHALGVPRFNLGTRAVSPFLAVTSVLFSFHNVLMQSAGWFSYCLNILWSISVEEAFYFTFPLLCLMGRRTRFIALAWIAIIIAGPIHRAVWTAPMLQSYGYLSCSDAIGFGCCAAILRPHVSVTAYQAVLMQCLGAGLVAFSSLARPGVGLVLGDSIVAFGIAMVLLTTGRALDHEASKVSAPLRWFGQHSYELCLFHIILLALLRARTGKIAISLDGRFALFVLFLGGSAALAWLVARFYSEVLNRPIRALFVHFYPLPAAVRA